jgi:outer membrane protein assembly factor BamB
VKSLFEIGITWLLLGSLLFADDWSQWRGINRDGVSSERDLLSEWPEQSPPKSLWRIQVGQGHSAITVQGERAFTMGSDGTIDTVFCVDIRSGKVLWKQSYPCETIKQWPGPRSTPCIFKGRVVTLSQHGLVCCFEAESGAIVWQKQLDASYNPDIDYGFAWSPLVIDGLVILGGGSHGMALRMEDGSFAWGDDGKAGACASPVPTTYEGSPAILLVSNQDRESVSLVCVAPQDGSVLWQSNPWPEKWGAACVDPVISDGKVFLTTAEQHVQCGLFLLKPNSTAPIWSHARLPCYTGGCVAIDGMLFGVTKSGVLKCLEFASGKESWSERGFGEFGSMIAADGMIWIQTSEQGELVVVRASREKYQEIKRLAVFDDGAKSFTPPTIANGRLYCRSYDGEVTCYLLNSTSR